MSLSVLVAVTHLLGIGHLSRAAAIARALAARGHRVTLASGGMPAPLIDLTGVDLVQLPPVRTLPGDFRTLLDASLRPVGPDYLAERLRLLRDEAKRTKPEALITELFPFGRRGLADEFLGLIGVVRDLRPEATVVSSIRDILVAPAKEGRIAETHERLASQYDAVLVHGELDIVPLDASWPLDEGARRLIHYTGFVDAEAAPSSIQGLEPAEIVVSGGGSAAGLPLFRAAAATATSVPDRRWLILIGGGVDEASFAQLATMAPAHCRIERARPDFRTLLAQAELSVSQSGYNTVIDVLASGVRAVFVPFEQGHETEQRLRAERLAKEGRAVLLPEARLDEHTLAEAVRTALAGAKPASLASQLDGAARSAAIIERLAASSRRPNAPASRASIDPAWTRLGESLARAADTGLALPFWWRDDDAVAHTAALDRLIALSRRAGWPLALAAIPAFAQASLAARVADESGVAVLVHGWSHHNHAPREAKKSEFGADRPIEAARVDAARALAIAQQLFGRRLCPVFVPPWNRVDPALLPHLSAAGYAAYSAFGSGDDATAGLRRLDTHLDPIAWRGSRGLADPAILLARLAETVAARVQAGGPAAPIGLLTHHLVHTEPVWTFCERLVDRLSASSGVRVRSIDALIEPSCRRHASPMVLRGPDGLEIVPEGGR